MNRIIKLSKENVPIEWKQYGCKRILDVEEICEPLFKKVKENKGLGINNEIKINKIVKEKRSKGLILNSPSNKTLKRYNNDVQIKGILENEISL